ncbi:hypothetical protein FCV50_11405 [Vibrio kanaloae]|jgi:hypothetical protein|uniref:Uncharacterized protein n=1 Tax=Vibrio kanaloae TaxID=170673 RepID=A0A4U1ZCC2_9VIBR|nr:hypothetical protein [Vibrio kanaloae]TKF31642.1 hypothetical protein FCV50_11405 [Vibrio kanaloae]
MLKLIVSFDKSYLEYHVSIFMGEDGFNIWADEYRVEERMEQLLLMHNSQVVCILKLGKKSEIGHAVLARLEEIRKQDDAPQVGADSSPA